MAELTETDFFTREDSPFHKFPAEEKVLIQMMLYTLSSAEKQQTYKRLGMAAIMTIIGLWLFSSFLDHPVPMLVIAGITWPIVLFVEPIREFAAEHYWRTKDFIFFGRFNETDIYKASESGINAILQRNGWTYKRERPVYGGVSIIGLKPSGIYPYDPNEQEE